METEIWKPIEGYGNLLKDMKDSMRCLTPDESSL